jgi:hypothetical protein
VIDCETSGDEGGSRSGLEEENVSHFATDVAPYVDHHFLCCADAGHPEEREFANDAWADQVPLVWGLRCAWRSWSLQCTHNNDVHNDAVNRGEGVFCSTLKIAVRNLRRYR